MFGARFLLGQVAAIAAALTATLSDLRIHSDAEPSASVAIARPDASLPDGSPDVRPRITGGGQPIDVTRDDDGLFYLVARVNGVPVRFLIDTGASFVILTQADAERAGVKPDEAGAATVIQTAAGETPMAWARMTSVQVGRRDIQQVRAAINRHGLPVSLMGQNLLAELGPVVLDGDRMRVDPRGTTRS